MTTETQDLSREMAHAYLTGTGPRTNCLSSPPCQRIITLIMQNKPNLLDTQMNLSSASTKHYENDRLRTRPKNKPNQTQSQPRPLCKRTPYLSGTCRESIRNHSPTKPNSPALPTAERSEVPASREAEAKSRSIGDLSRAHRGLLPSALTSSNSPCCAKSRRAGNLSAARRGSPTHLSPHPRNNTQPTRFKKYDIRITRQAPQTHRSYIPKRYWEYVPFTGTTQKNATFSFSFPKFPPTYAKKRKIPQDSARF